MDIQLINKIATRYLSASSNVADTIARQLARRGVAQIRAMTGAKYILHDDNALIIKGFKGSKGIYGVTITLDPSDSYTVEFFTKSGSVVESFSDVYADSLTDLFESTTGLYLSI